MKLSIQEIIKIYREVKNIRKTAELTGYSKSGIEYLLKKNNIELFSQNRPGNENSCRKAIENLDPNDSRRLVRNPVYMFELYVQNKMSIPEIATKLKISNTTVLTGLNQCGIKRRSKKEALKGKPRPNSKGWKTRYKLKPSYPEQVTIDILNNLNIFYVREYKCGKWFIDFADVNRKLALEIDGKQHELPERKSRDERKDQYLSDNGWRILRIKWKRISKEFRKELILKLKEFFKEVIL